MSTWKEIDRMKRIVWSLAVGAILAATSLSWAQEKANVAADFPRPGPISLSISADQDSAVAGSALLLTVKMTNASLERYCYRMVRGFANGIYNFPAKVLNANGETVKPSPAVDTHAKVMLSSKTECLQGGAAFFQTMRLDQLFDLSGIGTYTVQVSRMLGRSREKVFSNTIRFKIVP
jgi:hypothetical protein